MQKEEDIKATEKLSSALAQFRFLYHYGKRAYNGNKKEPCTLRPSDVMLLFAIKHAQKKHADGVTATELSDSMGIKPPSINSVLSVLEKNNLIKRATDPSDRRFVRITISEEGENQTKQFREKYESEMRGLVAYLGIEKSNTLADLMNEVYLYCYEQHKNHCHSDKIKK